MLLKSPKRLEFTKKIMIEPSAKRVSSYSLGIETELGNELKRTVQTEQKAVQISAEPFGKAILSAILKAPCNRRRM